MDYMDYFVHMLRLDYDVGLNFRSNRPEVLTSVTYSFENDIINRFDFH